MKKRLIRKWWVLIGVGISSMIVAIDFTIVNTVLLDIQQYFSSSMHAMQWVMAGFGITFSASLVSAGRLGDLLGRRRVLYIGMLGFGLASLGAGLSMHPQQLIIARLCQGVFAATIFPCGMAITAQAFGKAAQGRALAIYGSFLGIGMAIGPVLGGLISSFWNWRWIFLINIPVILVSFLICILNVEESRITNKVPMDWAGMILLNLGLGGLVFAVMGSQIYGWGSALIMLALAVALLCFISFFFLQKRMAAPLLPPALFLNYGFFIGVMVYVVGISFIWPILFFVPLYLQDVLKFNMAMTGFLLLPMTAMTVIAPALAGYLLHRYGTFLATLLTFAMSIVGLVTFLFVSSTFCWPLLLLAFVSIGLAWGIANGIAIPLALSDPGSQQEEGLISGAAVTILNVLGVLSLAVAGTLFHHQQSQQLLLGHSSLTAFMGGFHLVMAMLLVLTVIFLVAVLQAFKNLRQQ